MFLRQRNKFVLNATVEQVVGRLLGDVARDAQPLADHERLHHHPGWVGRAADVAHFPERTRSSSACSVSSCGISSDGRWIWYRSMWSVPSRRSESSQARIRW